MNHLAPDERIAVISAGVEGGSIGAACRITSEHMRDVAGRTRSRIQLTIDGHRVHADAVENAFAADIDYAMLVKLYGVSNDSPESPYGPATCIEGVANSCAEGAVSSTRKLLTFSGGNPMLVKI